MCTLAPFPLSHESSWTAGVRGPADACMRVCVQLTIPESMRGVALMTHVCVRVDHTGVRASGAHDDEVDYTGVHVSG